MAIKTRNLAAIMVSISMLPVILPMKSASAAGKELFSEDFESYAVGAVTVTGNKAYDNDGKLIPTSYVTLKNSDHLEIEEDNGNKYLVIYTERNNTGTRTNFSFLFDDSFSGGTKEVSYDIMPKAHYACFRRLGILTYDKSSHTEKNIQRLMTQGANIITKLQNVVFGWTSDFQSSKFGGSFGTITQTVNYEADAGNYNVTLKYGTTTRSKTLTIADINTKPIYGIVWDFSSNESGGANGSDSPFVDNEVSYGVYCIDNVKVTTVGLSVEQASISNEGTISVNDNVEVTFDDTIADDYADHIGLYRNEELLSEDKYTLSLSGDKKTLTVSGFDYNFAYTLKIDKSLKSADGKPMADEYELSFKTNSIISHNVTKERYEEGFIPAVTTISGIDYEYSISKDGNSFEDYDFYALSEKGNYKLKIVATDEADKQQTEIVEFNIVGAVEPEATNVNIVALETLEVGAELKGKYTYFDSNDEADENMDYCTYQWYRSSSESGGFVAIDGANGDSYILTAEDEDQYIKFGVKPYSKVEPKEGQEALSDAFLSFMNPSASNVRINGKTTIGEQLSVGYEYTDLNGDAEFTEGEIATEVIWFISETQDGEYIETGRGRNYDVKVEDGGKWIRVSVIPKNGGAGRQDKSFYSHAVKIANKDYFAEDFEGYEVGVIATGPVNTISAVRNPGGLVYKLAEGDTLEIVEKDGSKVLKLTTNKTDAAERQVFLDFDRHYGNNRTYDVDFDYYVENNSVWFNDFGTLYDDEISGHSNYVHNGQYNPIKIISSYRDNLYFNGNTNSENYIGAGLLASASGFWKHQNMRIDFLNEEKPFKITTTKKSDGSQLASKEAVVTYTHGGKAEELFADNISSVSWRFKRNSTAGWNGQDEGEGVYYIDNITLKASGMSVISSVIDGESVVLTFDNAVAADAGEHISILKDGELISKDSYSISVEDGKITVSGLEYNADYEINVDNTLKSQSGKLVLSETVMRFKTSSLLSYEDVSRRHSQGYVPAISAVGGATCSYFISKDEGEYEEYNQTPISEIGKYKLKVVADGGTGKTQTEVISFEIVGPVAPEAENVDIEYTGTLDVGTVLNGTYTYFDVNDSTPDINKDYCTYQWYRSSDESGGFVEIAGANGSSYTLTAEDEDKYIKFGVKPYSKVSPKEGEEYLSDAFSSFMNPTVSNVEIIGKMATDEQLTVSYDYFDSNGDAEVTEGGNATIVIWYTSESLGGTYTEVGRGRIYTIKDTDSNKWFKACIIPKNNGGGSQNKEFYSQEVMGAFAPVASNVRLIGNASVGSTISVDYRFYDANQDSESGALISWYVNGAFVLSAAHYTISENDKGKSIYAEVTPNSSAKPTAGTPVKSDIRTVSDSTNAVKPSGGAGGGGAGGGGGGITIPNNNGNVGNGGNTPSQKGFGDTSGHWAEQAILKMVEKGIIFGKSDNKFAPEDKITRAEFAAIIGRMFKLTDSGYRFDDVAEDSWYSGSVTAVASAGYMMGSDGKFRPEANITREEMAVVIAAITKAKGIEGSGETASFSDFNTISDWAKNAVSIMADIGIINGMEDNSFVPKGAATRAQTVMMLTKLQDVLDYGN